MAEPCCGDEFTLEEIKKTIRSHVIDFGLTICLCIITGGIVLWGSPNNRFFIERDESLSYPMEHGFANGEEVPTWMAMLLAGPVVMIILVLMRIMASKLLKLQKDNNKIHPKTLNIFVVELAFSEALALAMFITEFIKRFVGRKRPNFFAMCNYHGYREAISTLPYNLTQYLSLTQANFPGDIKNCQGTPAQINEAMYSFPSGHSSAIWTGMTFVGIYSVYLFHYYTHKNNMAKGMLAMFFFFAAILISCTRPRDYWHNFDDILAGSVIGFSCSCFSFILNYSNILSKLWTSRKEDINNEHTRLVKVTEHDDELKNNL